MYKVARRAERLAAPISKQLPGIFIPIVGEMYEMRYQYDCAYVFDSSKFNKRYNYVPTSNAEAVKQVVAGLR